MGKLRYSLSEYKLTEHEIGFIDHLLKTDKEWWAIKDPIDIDLYRIYKILEAQLKKVEDEYETVRTPQDIGYDSYASMFLSSGGW